MPNKQNRFFPFCVLCLLVCSVGLFAGILCALAERLKTKQGRLVTNSLFRQGVFANALTLCASGAYLSPTERVLEHDVPRYVNSRADRSPSIEVYESSDRRYFSLVASPEQSAVASAELAASLGCDNSTEAVAAALSKIPFADIDSLMHKLKIPVVVKTDSSISPVHDPRLKNLLVSFANETAPPSDCPKVRSGQLDGEGGSSQRKGEGVPNMDSLKFRRLYLIDYDHVAFVVTIRHTSSPGLQNPVHFLLLGQARPAVQGVLPRLPHPGIQANGLDPQSR